MEKYEFYMTKKRKPLNKLQTFTNAPLENVLMNVFNVASWYNQDIWQDG